MTRDALTATTPTRAGALCVVCGTWTTVPVELGYIERVSGPGVTLWGCPAELTTASPAPMPGEVQRGA